MTSSCTGERSAIPGPEGPPRLKAAPPSIPPQFLEAGIYENRYVREDGVWKFKLFDYKVVYQCDFSTGWANAPDAPLMVSEHRKTFPESASGPDALEAQPDRWPKAVVMPFHYRHPVTGEPIRTPVGGFGVQQKTRRVRFVMLARIVFGSLTPRRSTRRPTIRSRPRR